MTRTTLAPTAVAIALASALVWAAPSVYPTGTTIYDPARAWSGYTVLSLLNTQAVVVIDMNGRVVKRWDDFNNAAGGPARVLPGGSVIAAVGAFPGHQESLALVLRDFDGNEMWRLDRNEPIEVGGETTWSLRQHHDWQRADFPAGYYSPDATPGTAAGTTLVLTHTNRTQQAVADGMLEDDRLIELSPDDEIVWEWLAGDHIDELGFDEEARAAIRSGGAPARGGGAAGGRAGGRRGAAAGGRAGGRGGGGGRGFDWLHVNSATYVGPNRWFDSGDARFDPRNVIISSRQANIVAIVARDGSIAWRIGPDFLASAELRAIGQIIGQHHAHVIPKGLPGAGNMLIFDNGGAAGYGASSAMAPRGSSVYARATSRVLEIDPVSLELVWSYTSGQFYSSNISGAQRLPNGNTLVTEGAGGRLFEVTADREIVWEYMNPLFGGAQRSNGVYRAYRLPYDWISQLARPVETAVTPPPLEEFALP